MSEDTFYDQEWKKLARQQPLVARKIEDLHCESVGYEEFEALRKRVDRLESQAPAEVKARAEEDFESLLFGSTIFNPSFILKHHLNFLLSIFSPNYIYKRRVII